jgi:membrane protein implicated in regulation of membrane protease activity
VNGFGLTGATRRVADHARSIARLELQLAAAEVKKKLSALAAGIGVSAGAALFAFYALGFGLAAAAAGLATTLSVWLSLLIVFGGLVLLALIFGLIGYSLIRQGSNPVPEQAIEEAQRTTEALRNGQQ